MISKSKESEGEKQGYGWLKLRPMFLGCLDSSRFLLLLLCSYFTANSAVVNGLYSTSISTIEKRFSLSSTRMGMVTSVYDIAALIFTGPVSYFGVRNRPVTLGLGMITMGIGYLVFTLPHFIAEEYIPVTGQSGLPSNYSNPVVCALSGSRAPTPSCDSKKGSDVYYSLFTMAMFIAGAGCTPMLSVGIPFLDQSVSKNNSPWYIGLFQASGIAAAMVGFVLSSAFLSTFVHPNASVSITEKSPLWVGAWWMGFMIGSAFAFIIGILLTGMPKLINKEKGTKSESTSKFEMDELEQKHPKLHEIPAVLKTLVLRSRTFIFISAAVACQSFLISGGMAFNAKMALFQYRLTASQAGIYYGIASCMGATLGNVAGSLVLKRFKLSSLGTLKLTAIVSAVTFLLSFSSFIYCDTYPVPGINSNFPKNSNDTSFSLHQSCNSKCSCRDLFLPLCNNGMTYVNPCVAGCKKIESAMVFSNCSCLPSIKSKVSKGTIGICSTSCGMLPALYFTAVFLIGFFIMFNATPCTMATLRSVPFNLRSFAMGLQWMLVRVLGSIPGPIIYGYVIDSACAFWSKKCNGTRGSCTVYNNREMAMKVGVLTVGINFVVLAFIALAYYSEKGKTGGTEAGQEMQSNDETVDQKLHAVEKTCL